MNYIHVSTVPIPKHIEGESHVYLDTYAATGYLDLNVPFFNPNTDVLIKENVHSDDFIRIYLKYFNPHKDFCSHVLYMDNGRNRFILTDAAMNIEPTLVDFTKIIENATTMWRALNPSWEDDIIHINFVNYSGSFSIKNKDAITANTLREWCDVEHPGEFLFTNWQIDSCLYDESRRKKEWQSSLECPQIILVPNISVGNAIYKCLMKEYKCYGFLVGGTTTAVLNSRSDLDKNEECLKILSNKGIME